MIIVLLIASKVSTVNDMFMFVSTDSVTAEKQLLLLVLLF